MLIVILVLQKIEIEDEEDDEDDGKNKNANPLRRAEPIRVVRFVFIFSFATSQGGVKGTNFVSSMSV